MPNLDIQKDLIANLIDKGEWDEVASVLLGQHPADLADMIGDADSEDRERLFSVIEEDAKPGVLAELRGRAEEEVLDALSNLEISEIVEEMPPDDAADVIADLPEERSVQVLDLMEKEESEEVRELLKYDEETAGGIMTTDVVTLSEGRTVDETFRHIAESDVDEPFFYAYVVDDQNTLLGYIGLWELLRIKDRSILLRDVVHTDIVSVPTDMDQEQVAKLASKYDLTALPVVDDHNRLLGRITSDDVMDVLEEEASEDIFLLAGSDDAELDFASPVRSCITRLPWLLITLGAGFVTSLILKNFMSDFSQVLALTFFVPILLAMGGGTGIQSSTLIVRGLALGTIRSRSIRQVIQRELITGAIMGMVCGTLIGIWTRFLITGPEMGATGSSPTFLAITVGFALFSAMTFAALFGAFVPVVLERCKVDPAVAAGPFVTASNDIVALLIYYGIALGLIALYYQTGPSGAGM